MRSTARRRGATAVAWGTTVLAWVWASPASACPVCYGNAEGDMIDAAQISVLFMLGLTYVVLGGGVAAMFLIRAKKARGDDHVEIPGPP